MQAINLKQTLIDGLFNIPNRFHVFFFDGTMPTDLNSLPFDLNLKELMANSVYYFLYPTREIVNNKISFSRSDNLFWTGFNKGPYIPYNANYNRVVSRYCYWTSSTPIGPDAYFSTYRESLSNLNLIDRTRLVQEWNSFYEIGRQNANVVQYFDQPVTVSAFGFRQVSKTYTYGLARTKAYSWAQSVRFYHWDDTLNEGAGGWVASESDFNCGSTTNQFDLPAAITTRAIRIQSKNGQWGSHPGHVVYDDPQWRFYHLNTLVDNQVQAESAVGFSSTWAIIYPYSSDKDTESCISRPSWYNPITDQAEVFPVMIVDAGDPGSGATIELINNPVPSNQQAQTFKFNIKIDD